MRRNSGNIGPLKDSTISSTSGVYDTFDGYNYRLDNLWPRAVKVELINLTTGSTSLKRGVNHTFRVNAEGYTDQTLYITWENVGAGWVASDDTGGSFATCNIVNGVGTFSLVTALNTTTISRAAVTFQIGIRTTSTTGTLIATSATYTILAAGLTITPASSSVNQGVSNTITVAVTNLNDGTYNWAISYSPSITFSATSGSFTISGGSGSFSILAPNDFYTTGNCTVTVAISYGGYQLKTNSYTIVDSSTTPTFSVNNNAASEGSTATFTASVPGSNGIAFNWYLDTGGGTSSSDFADGATSGTVYGDGSNNISISRQIADDSLIESESFRLQINNQYGTTIAYTPYVNITDNTTVITGYTATPSISQVEGSSFSITPIGAGLTGKTIAWTINPGSAAVTAADFSQGLSGTITGAGPLTLTPVADSTWEGNETFTVSFAYNGTTLYTTPTLKIWDTSIEAGATAVTKNFNVSTATLISPVSDNSYCGGGYGDYLYNHHLVYRGTTGTASAPISKVICYGPNVGSQEITLDASAGAGSYTISNNNANSSFPYSGDYAFNFSPDGGKFIIYSPSNSTLRIYTCSTPWTFNSSDPYTSKSSFYTSNSNNVCGSIAINHTGTKIIFSYIYNSNNALYYDTATLATPYDASSISGSTFTNVATLSNVNTFLAGSAYWASIASFEFNRFGTEITVLARSSSTPDTLATYALTTPYDLTGFGSATPITTKSFAIPSTSYSPPRIKGFAFDRQFENRVYILYASDNYNCRVAAASLSLELYGDAPPQEAFDITTLTMSNNYGWAGAQAGSIQPTSVAFSNPITKPVIGGTSLPVYLGGNQVRYVISGSYSSASSTPTQLLSSMGNSFSIYLTKTQTSYGSSQDPWLVDTSSVYATLQLGSGYQGTITNIIDFDIYPTPMGNGYYLVASYYDSNYNYVRFARWTCQGNAVGYSPFAYGIWSPSSPNGSVTANFDMDMGYISGWTYTQSFAKFQFNKDGTKVTMFDKANYRFDMGITGTFKMNTYTLNAPFDFTGIGAMTPTATKNVQIPASNPAVGAYSWYMPYSYAFDRVNRNKMYTSHPYYAQGYPYGNAGYSLIQEWNFASEVISWTSNTPYATTGMKPLGCKAFSSTATSFSITFDTTGHANQFLSFMQSAGDLISATISIHFNGKQRDISWLGSSGIGGGSLSSSWNASGAIVTFANASASSIYTIYSQTESAYGYNTIQFSVGQSLLSSISTAQNALKVTFSDASYATALKTAFTNSSCGIMGMTAFTGSNAPYYTLGALNTNTCGIVDKTDAIFKMGFQTTLSSSGNSFGTSFNFFLAEALGPAVTLPSDGVVRTFGPSAVSYQGGYGYVSFDTADKATAYYNLINAYQNMYTLNLFGQGTGGYFMGTASPMGQTVTQQSSTMLYLPSMNNGGSGGPSSPAYVEIGFNSGVSWSGQAVVQGTNGYVQLFNYSGPSLNATLAATIYVNFGNGTYQSGTIESISSISYGPGYVTISGKVTLGSGGPAQSISMRPGVLVAGQNITAGPYQLYYTYLSGTPRLYFNSQADANAFKDAIIADSSGVFQVIDGNGITQTVQYPSQYATNNFMFVQPDYDGYGSGYKLTWSGSVQSYYFYTNPGNSGTYGGSTVPITYFQAAGGGAVIITSMYYSNGNPLELDFVDSAAQTTQLNAIQSAAPGTTWRIEAYNGYTNSQDVLYVQFNTTMPDNSGTFPGGAYMYWSSYKYSVPSYQQYNGTKGQGQGTITKL